MLFIISIQTFAQLNIKGQVLDTENKSLEAVSVMISDTTHRYIDGVITTDKGMFNLKNIPSGNYIINISLIGFENVQMKIQNGNDNLDLGKIYLKPNNVNLDEIVVEGRNNIKKANSDIYIPTQIQKKVSSNGIELLNSLSISGIYVNPIDLKVSKIDGNSVELRINNMRSTIERVSSLRPENILRIEYYDLPTGMYGGNDYSGVVNYVTMVHSETGGYIQTSLMSALNTGFSNDQMNFSFNTKSSEFNLNYFFNIRDYSKYKEDGYDEFYFNKNNEYRRNKLGMNQPYRYTMHTISASYQLQSKENYMLNILFSTQINRNHLDRRAWYETNSLNNDKLFTKKESWYPYSKPTFDIYFLKKLRNNQEIALNTIGTYWDEDYNTDFSQTKENIDILNYRIYANGKKKSIIAEAMYSKKWKQSNFVLGVRHTQGFSKNTYTGTNNYMTHLNQAISYFYTEFSSNIQNLSYSLGAGLSRSYFSEDISNHTYYNFRPSLSLKWNINENHAIINRFRILSKNPNISDLSNVERSVDSIQITKGNPYLKPYYYYINSFIYNYNKNKVTVNTELNYEYRHKPIMENLYYNDNRLILTNDNQDNWSQIKAETQLSISSLWDILRFSLGGGFIHQKSLGKVYSHSLSYSYLLLGLSVNYKGFSFSGNYKTRTKSLIGESYSTYAPDLSLQLSYMKGNKWLIGITAWNPFFNSLINKFEIKSKLTNQYKKVSIGDNGNLFSMRFIYYFSFGKKYDSVKKNINNVDGESGILK
jgi:hypothetical protein